MKFCRVIFVLVACNIMAAAADTPQRKLCIESLIAACRRGDFYAIQEHMHGGFDMKKVPELNRHSALEELIINKQNLILGAILSDLPESPAIKTDQLIKIALYFHNHQAVRILLKHPAVKHQEKHLETLVYWFVNLICQLEHPPLNNGITTDMKDNETRYFLTFSALLNNLSDRAKQLALAYRCENDTAIKVAIDKKLFTFARMLLLQGAILSHHTIFYNLEKKSDELQQLHYEYKLIKKNKKCCNCKTSARNVCSTCKIAYFCSLNCAASLFISHKEWCIKTEELKRKMQEEH